MGRRPGTMEGVTDINDIPGHGDPATTMVLLAAAIRERLDRLPQPAVHPALRSASVQVLDACGALTPGEGPPPGFVEVADRFANNFDDDAAVWPMDDVNFAVELAAANLAVVAAQWANDRPDPDGDPWAKQVSAVRGGLRRLDDVLGSP